MKETGTVHNALELRTPINCVRVSDGQPVKVIQTGDVEGNSPSGLSIDGDGRFAWMSLDDYRVTDQNFLPPSREQLANTARRFIDETASSSRSGR